VLRQSFTDYEIIVSDNASEEDIVGVIREAADRESDFINKTKIWGRLGMGCFCRLYQKVNMFSFS